ncbi:hypothetical protein LUZ61_012067 [Rhynchospora tenuis]|uniref:Reverse transcriptase zinc-binding domain-containing protein n=1 Tax=Rhynchospora tenuis TaxID=198213 RepID=A0AAD6A280_9POAL|nr:hypothetical protein LUZ61_012067 [Rhynchospora tenuis]
MHTLSFLLLHKLQSKLGGWKRDLLSHASRMTLIKSTLTSLPVHFFSITLFNKGIRDLHTFNKFLMLKNVWAIALNKSSLWVQQVTTKYCSDRGLWGTNKTRNCSQLWKDIQNLKGFFKDDIFWDLQNGQKIQAQNQPWHRQWNVRTRKPHNQGVHVADLYDEASNKWDQASLHLLFNVRQCESILANAALPETNALTEDRLIWSKSKTGCYSTKEGYAFLMKELQPHQNYPFHWTKLWTCKLLLPKIKVFIWRTIHNGLITSEKLNKFIPAVQILCTLCGNSTETPGHVLFKCHMARTTWFLSSLAIRTEQLSDNFLEAFNQITINQDPKIYAKICSILWCIWKARNNFFFRGICPNQIQILQEADLLVTNNAPKNLSPRQNKKLHLSEISEGARVVLIDASWNTNKRTGLGILCYDQSGSLSWTVSHSIKTASPFTAETEALFYLVGITQLHKLQENKGLKLSSPLEEIRCVENEA